jgi:hypothetical protein
LQQGGMMPSLRKQFGGASHRDVLKDLKENDGRGIEETLQTAEDTEDEHAADEDQALNGAGNLEAEHVFEDPDADVYSSNELPTLVTSEGLHTVDKLANLRHGLDDETAEFLVSNRVAALWTAYIDRKPVDDALRGEGGYYFNLIRSRFQAELEGVENLAIPDDWAFTVGGEPALPNMMQRRTAWEVLTKKRLGNWSGVGAGKTLAAVLASRVCGAAGTLIVAHNSTLNGWWEQIRAAFPGSVIHTSVPDKLRSGQFNYIVLNYEKFQQPNRGELVRNLIAAGVEFVVFDEVHLVKQRDRDASIRREALASLVSALEEQNPDLRVLGMSATPVINNLMEARKLLEIVTGRSHADLDIKPTVNNALTMHRSLMVSGFRYRPRYEIEMHPEPVKVEGNHLLGEVVNSDGVLGLEQALLPAKLKAITPYVHRGTLVYLHYVEGMVSPTRRHLEAQGLKVGEYTGADKTGLEPFKRGELDVLIGSRAIGTGVDGLQGVSDRIVMLSLPWTGAEYEQIIGRIRRQGSAFGSVSIVVPEVVLDHEGDQWSWDKGRMGTIHYKRTLSDCAVDGKVPETVRISEAEMLRQSREALERWIERISGNGFQAVDRQKLAIPLPPVLREKLKVQCGDFSVINNRWATSNSTTTHERLQADTSEWYLYHTLYREAREGWPETPADHVAEHLKDRADLKVGDFGCGECILKKSLPEHEMIGLDHVAVDDSVVACDMAHAPLEDGSLGAAVFSLSLMGRNWVDYLAEAHRVLKPFGLLFVAEPAKRWEEGRLEQAVKEYGFNLMFSYQRGNFRYLGAVKGVV